MTKTDDASPDLFAGVGEGVGVGSGEGTSQVGGDPGETMPGAEPDPGDMDPFGDPAEDEGAAEPGGDAPLASAASSGVGHRDAGDTGDIGSTDGMAASFGGLAGTSR